MSRHRTRIFFPIVTYLSVGSNASFRAHLQLGARKVSSLYIFMARFLLTSLLYNFPLSTLERTRIVVSLPLVVSGCGNISISACTCANVPRTSSPPKSFLITTCASALLLSDYYWMYSFIYLLSNFLRRSLLIFNHLEVAGSILTSGE